MTQRHLIAWFLVLHACGLATANDSEREALNQPSDGGAESQRWKERASSSLNDLRDMCDTLRSELEGPDKRASRRLHKRIDQRIVSLWLDTGFPPQMWDGKETSLSCVERNMERYSQFLDENAQATDEQVVRRGIETSLGLMESRYVYLARRYFSSKVEGSYLPMLCLRPFDCEVLIEPWFASVLPELDAKLSGMTRNWYRDNSRHLKWRPSELRFEADRIEALRTSVKEEYVNWLERQEKKKGRQ